MNSMLLSLKPSGTILLLIYVYSFSLNSSFIPPRLPNMFVASKGRNTVFA